MKTTREVILEQQAINRKLWAKKNGRMHHVDANKLIAEFMGYEVKHNKCYSPKYNDGTIAPMQFHSSWDWLMPVIEKCVRTGDDTDKWDNIFNTLTTLSIKEVYEEVVEFIEDYNNYVKI
jgi:hypothetical protein